MHWKFNDWNGEYVNIYCPTISDYKVTGLAMCREIVIELRNLEKLLKEENYKGWICWTKLVNVHIMKLLTKLKANPFRIDVKKEIIWFAKEL